MWLAFKHVGRKGKPLNASVASTVAETAFRPQLFALPFFTCIP